MVWLFACGAMTTLLVHHDVTDQGRVAAIGIIASSTVLVVRELLAWRRGAFVVRDRVRALVGMGT